MAGERQDISTSTCVLGDRLVLAMEFSQDFQSLSPPSPNTTTAGKAC